MPWGVVQCAGQRREQRPRGTYVSSGGIATLCPCVWYCDYAVRVRA